MSVRIAEGRSTSATGTCVSNPFFFKTGKLRDTTGDPTCGAYCDETCFAIKQARLY